MFRDDIIKACGRYLASYMIPSKWFFVTEFPLNTNGKIDRVKLSDAGKIVSSDVRPQSILMLSPL